MTIREVVDTADRMRPNAHTMQDKLRWLTGVERMVADFMNLHENTNIPMPVYKEGMDIENTEVLLDYTDAEVYTLWLVMKYDLHNGDYESYNNMAMAYNDQMKMWEAEYRRTHMPKSGKGWKSV